MKTLKCVIIDDEPIAIDYLKQYVQKIPQLELIATFNNALEAYDKVLHQEIDLLFLDIQMPHMNGLDFIRTLSVKPAVILTTAYSQYAIEGFDLEVNDYLLKPISFERFTRAVMKVLKQYSLSLKNETNTEVVSQRFVFLRQGYKSFKINIEDILYIEGAREYAIYYTKDGRKYMKNERMKKIESQLSKDGFLRVHKSYLVNMKHIKAIYGNTIEIGKVDIPIGRAYKERLNELEK